MSPSRKGNANSLKTGSLMSLTRRSAVFALDSHRKVSHEKAARALGHRPRPLAETVRDTMRWYESQGMLA